MPVEAPIPEGNRAAFFIGFGFYSACILGIAIFSWALTSCCNRPKDKDEAYSMHFVGMKSYPSPLLFLTLFSTVFSAYTVVGIPKEAAGLGFYATRWLTAWPMAGISSLLLLPRFRRLSVVRKYDSPCDLVTDRFDNRLLSVVMALLATVPQVLFLITQFFTMYNLSTTLSDGQMDPGTTVVFLAVIVLAVEMLGGFHSVALTDVLQGSLMLIALFMTPVLATHFYGGAGASTQLHCLNSVEVNCSLPEFQGAVCDGEVVVNGCLANTHVHLTLHPARMWSQFSRPFWDSEDSRLRGVDHSSPHLSNVAANMFSFNILFSGFTINAHWLQRTIAARTDTAVKRASIAMNLAGLIAVLPGILVGIMIAANLVQVNPPAEPYALLLEDFMHRGRFSEFIGILCACSALAAIMSSADSALLGITNVLTKEFLLNWLFVSCPSLNTRRNLSMLSKLLSTGVVILSLSFALGWEELHDPRTSAEVYGRLVSLQNSLLWLGLPTFALGLWLHRAKAWALLAGIAAGVATFTVIMSYTASCQGYGTEMAVCQPKTIYLDPAVWAGLVNFSLALVLSTTSYAWQPECLRMGLRERFGQNELSGPEIERIMSGTQEPAMTDTGMLCILLALLLCNLSLPWYGDSYDGCDVLTYAQWRNTTSPENPLGVETEGCSGGAFIWGIPAWAFNIMLCYGLAVLANTVAFLQWRTCDEEELDVGLFVLQPPDSDEELPEEDPLRWQDAFKQPSSDGSANTMVVSLPDDQELLEPRASDTMAIGEEGGRWGNLTALEVIGVAGVSRNHGEE